MIVIGIFIVAIMGTILLVSLDMLVYRVSFQSSLLHLFSIPSNYSAYWFLAGAIITAGWSDLQNTAYIKRLVFKLSRKRG